MILFYRLFDHLGEEANACPLVRHLLTSSLERLGQAMIQENPQQCQALLERICRMPDYAQFLTAVFTPGCSERRVFLEMYNTINSMKESHSTLSFTLLSKVCSVENSKSSVLCSRLNPWSIRPLLVGISFLINHLIWGLKTRNKPSETYKNRHV